MVWVNVKSKGLLNIPGFPEVSDKVWSDTYWALQARKNEFEPAKKGLTREFTLGVGKDRVKRKAEDWLFPGRLADLRPGSFSLEAPKQFMISCTSYENQCDPGADDRLADEFAKELTDDKEAARGFWPRIAKFGSGYNLLGILRKVTDDKRLGRLKELFSEAPPGRPTLEYLITHPDLWTRIEALQKDGRLYERSI